MDEKKTGARTRARAAEAVDAVVNQGRSLDTALAQAESGINPSERGLARALCYGTLRFHWRLRSQLSALLDRPLKAKDSVIESLIAVGIYQLTDTRIPDHAAVSMTVEASRVLRRPKYASLINAVLRNFLRKNMLAKAEPLIRDVLRKDPVDVVAIRMLAEIGIKVGQLQDAQNLLQRCLELAPDFHLARHAYATVLMQA